MIEQYIARIVAFVLGPVIIVASTAGANWAQDFLGIPIDGAELAAYLGSVAVGSALLLYRWLQGRSEWELVEKAKEHVEHAHEVGAGTQEPTAPPGIVTGEGR